MRQVSLVNSALAVDGSGGAASVSVPGGNKTKLKAGVGAGSGTACACQCCQRCCCCLQYSLMPSLAGHREVSIRLQARAFVGGAARERMRHCAERASGGQRVECPPLEQVAVFKEVRCTAEAAGTYALRVQSASRKVGWVAGALGHGCV